MKTAAELSNYLILAERADSLGEHLALKIASPVPYDLLNKNISSAWSVKSSTTSVSEYNLLFQEGLNF